MANIRSTTDLGAILLAVKDKLTIDGLFYPHEVFLSLTPTKIQVPPSDQYALITPMQQVMEKASLIGGGRDYMAVRGSLSVTLWNRLNTDEVGRDTQFLADVALGVLGRFKCLVNSLTMFDPQNNDGNYILGEPMRLIQMELPMRVTEPHWGFLASTYSFVYQQLLAC